MQARRRPAGKPSSFRCPCSGRDSQSSRRRTAWPCWMPRRRRPSPSSLPWRWPERETCPSLRRRRPQSIGQTGVWPTSASANCTVQRKISQRPAELAACGKVTDGQRPAISGRQRRRRWGSCNLSVGGRCCCKYSTHVCIPIEHLPIAVNGTVYDLAHLKAKAQEPATGGYTASALQEAGRVTCPARALAHHLPHRGSGPWLGDYHTAALRCAHRSSETGHGWRLGVNC